MSLIETPDDYPFAWYLRPLLALMRRRLGRLPEPVRLWARTPLAFLGFQLMLRGLERRGSPIDARLRALLRTRIAQMNSCHFCVDLNASHALDRGASASQLEELARFRESSCFSSAEKDALAYAEAISATGVDIDRALLERLRRSFGDDGVVELAALSAHQNLSAKFNAALGIPAEGFCMSAHKASPPD